MHFRVYDTGIESVPKKVSARPDTQVKPSPKLEKRRRRTFKPEDKLRIIEEANACKHGELGALLRREKIYSNQLSDWRREYSSKGIAGLSKTLPGPAPLKSPEQRQIEKLEKQVTKLKADLDVANDCLDIQKKVLSILDRSSNGSMQ